MTKRSTEMWLIGMTLLLGVSSLALWPFLFNAREKTLASSVWDLSGVAIAFTELAGVLAALSLASAVFIATLSPDASSQEGSIGLFVIAFLILVAAAMQFATTPNARNDTNDAFLRIQGISYLTAAASFFLGIALTWLGLRLLLLAIHLDTAADILTWMLLLSVVAGAFRLTTNLYRHTEATAMACLLVVVLGVALPLLYRLAFASAWSDLWPERNEPLLLGTVGFVLVALGYSTQSVVLGLHGQPGWESVVSRFFQPWLTVYTLLVIEVVSLAWLSVAEQ